MKLSVDKITYILFVEIITRMQMYDYFLLKEDSCHVSSM